MSRGIRIDSNNLSGDTVHITFTPNTGDTSVDFGIVTFPASLVTDYYYGEYTISSQTYQSVYTYVISQGESVLVDDLGNFITTDDGDLMIMLEIVSPTPTPTNTPNPTVTPTVTTTPDPTPSITPSVTPSPVPVTGYGFNLIALPYNFPTSGNTIMTDSASGIQTGSTNPNLFVGPTSNGIYWNNVDIDGINRDSYFSQFTGQSVTFTISQNGSTAIYSGDSNSFQSWSFTGGTGYVFGYGIQQAGYPSPGDTVLIQSATTQWVIGDPVYISAVINNPVTPTPTPTAS